MKAISGTVVIVPLEVATREIPFDSFGTVMRLVEGMTLDRKIKHLLPNPGGEGTLVGKHLFCWGEFLLHQISPTYAKVRCDICGTNQTIQIGLGHSLLDLHYRAETEDET